jgi:hypothetical protein
MREKREAIGKMMDDGTLRLARGGGRGKEVVIAQVAAPARGGMRDMLPGGFLSIGSLKFTRRP